jgi:hypothetical protein
VSVHHRRQKWTTHSPKLRATITPRLPLPCVNCPHPVTPDQTFQVGHLRDAARGGRPTVANTGPSHTYCPACRKRCNQVAGGRLGAAITNGRRQQAKDIRPW